MYVLIANPVAGRQRTLALAARIEALLKAQGAAVELQVTAARGEARHLARLAAQQGVPAVVGVGGDGTLQEIAAALEGTETALGIIPCGRCNDFARALGLYRTASLERQAAILLAGRTRAVDLGAVGDQRFLTVATLGFDSEVSRFVETRKLWVKGTAAYLYGVIRVLLNFHPASVALRGDFGRFEGRVLLAATGNTPCYGGALQITPGARLDDGVFQLCVVANVPRLTVLQMLPRVMKGTHLQHPAVRTFTTRYVEVETPEGPQWICADGESLVRTPCRFEVRPKALRVITSIIEN